MFLEKYKDKFIIGYVIFLVLGALFVHNILTARGLEVGKKDTENPNIIEIKPAKVHLFIGDQQFTERMQNNNTFLDFLEALHDQGLIKYELNEYIYGTRFLHVNNIYANENYEWVSYIEDKPYKGELKGLHLTDETNYKLVFTRIEEPQ
ncbi:hypothetical protein ACFL13_01435 [Patescibacteria group bacterium]